MAVRQRAESPSHLSGEDLVTGSAKYIGDNLNFADMLYVYPVVSTIAHGTITHIDTSRALFVEGVTHILLAEDIPGSNGIGAVRREEEPLLASDEVMYVGQPIGIVLARSHEAARFGAGLVEVTYTPLPAVMTIDEALETNSLYQDPLEIHTGDIDAAFEEAAYVLEGVLESGAQEHLYLETNRAAAVPGTDGGIIIYSATQGITDVQDVTANILGVPSNAIEVDLMRVGGAFGGKERGGTMWAAMAALGCHVTGLPCYLYLERQDDLAWTGKRHPFKTSYRAACSDEGRILALDVELNANGGAFEDFTIPIVERAMLGVDGPYYIENTRIIGRGCRTNLPANTAFRGFGAPQASFVIESIIDMIAHRTGKDVTEIQRINFYKEGQVTPYGQRVYEAYSSSILDRLLERTSYEDLKREVTEFNAAHTDRKRGLGLLPIKYGIAFTATFLNQGNALIWVYTDGSISLSHGGVEMGQGLFTKIAKIVAKTLGVKLSRIRCESTNTRRIGSVASTAASSGTDINGYAAHLAALQIRKEMQKAGAQYLFEQYGLTPWPEGIEFEDDLWWDRRLTEKRESFSELAGYCYFNRYNLGAQAHYATPGLFYDKEAGCGTPFSYFSIGEALVEVEVDVLTGRTDLRKVCIVHEGGEILDYKIDRGQIAGGFMQGFGLCTMEELRSDPKTGRQLAATLSTYKVPSYSDLPEDFEIDLYPSRNKHASIFGSKGIGEPPLLYGLATYFAIKHALEALSDGRIGSNLKNPATPEHIVLEAERIIQEGKKVSTE